MRRKYYKLTMSFECGINCLWYSNSIESCKKKARFLAEVFGQNYVAYICMCYQKTYDDNLAVYLPEYIRYSNEGVYTEPNRKWIPLKLSNKQYFSLR